LLYPRKIIDHVVDNSRQHRLSILLLEVIPQLATANQVEEVAPEDGEVEDVAQDGEVEEAGGS
jgi:hypothetical protein